MVITLERRHWWVIVGFLALLVLGFFLNRRETRYIPPNAVWREARAQGRAHDIDPTLIYAIAMAESSLNASADSGFARGLMQVSEAAWSDVTTLDYRHAYDWRANLRVGTKYLAAIRDRLVSEGHYDAPRMVAAYRYGYGALAKQGFSVSQLPPPKNDIYRELFQGRIPDPREYGVTARTASAS